MYLLSIPMPMLFSVRLPIVKKFGLIALFSGGIFVMTAGTLRCVLILTVGLPVVLMYVALTKASRTQCKGQNKRVIGQFGRHLSPW